MLDAAHWKIGKCKERDKSIFRCFDAIDAWNFNVEHLTRRNISQYNFESKIYRKINKIILIVLASSNR